MGTSLASVLQKEKSIRNQTQEEFNKSTENVNSKNERGIAYNKHGFKFESKRQHSAANSGQICVSNGRSNFARACTIYIQIFSSLLKPTITCFMMKKISQLAILLLH